MSQSNYDLKFTEEADLDIQDLKENLYKELRQKLL